jgi:hypothetical protein
MNPVLKMWMFYNWIEDQRDDTELVKNHAYLVGSFHNPEAVKKLIGNSGQQFVSTDEEFDQSTKMIMQDAAVSAAKEKGKKKRKRKLKG